MKKIVRKQKVENTELTVDLGMNLGNL